MISPGVVLSNRYRLEERIATGGMGDVWRAIDVLLHRTVVVKVLLPSLVSDSEFITRVRTEARLMADLRHPSIVQVHDYGEQVEVGDSRLDYLVMAYVEGVPLAKWIKTVGRLGVSETASVVIQAAEALQVVHEAGIMHRDIKPSNLLVQPDGVVVLIDFGVACSADLNSSTSTNVVGSAHYMAPEQASGQPISAATDIYALGAVAYCCLAGHPPFTGDDPRQIAAQHRQGQPPALPADIPAPIAAVVTRALAKNPADRYPSAADFAAAVQAAQDVTSAEAFWLPAGAGMPEVEAVTSVIPVAPIQPAAPPAPPAPNHPAPVPDIELVPKPVLAPPPAAYGNRRRSAALAGIAGVVVLGLAAVLTVTAFSSPSDQGPKRSAAIESPATSGAGSGIQPTESPVGAPESGAGSSVQTTEGPTDGPTDGPGPTQGARPDASYTGSGPVTPPPTGGGAPSKATSGSSPKASKSPTSGSTSNPYTATQVCGSGYKVIDSATLTGYGKVYLLYNSSNGYNCTVTLKTTSVGKATKVSAYLEVRGKSRVTDSGSFAYYGGPVRAKAAGVCVKWGGSAGGVSYNSPFEHCG